jgi:hypothetical protein
MLVFLSREGVVFLVLLSSSHFTEIYVLPPPVSGANWRSPFRSWDSPPLSFSKMASSFTGSAHSPFPGYKTVIITFCKLLTSGLDCKICYTTWKITTFLQHLKLISFSSVAAWWPTTSGQFWNIRRQNLGEKYWNLPPVGTNLTYKLLAGLISWDYPCEFRGILLISGEVKCMACFKFVGFLESFKENLQSSTKPLYFCLLWNWNDPLPSW